MPLPISGVERITSDSRSRPSRRLIQPEATLALGRFYATKKKFDLAAAEYEKVLASSPKRIADLFEVANYYRDRGDAARVQRAVEAAGKIDPSDRRLSYYSGVSLVLQMSNPQDAEHDLRTYLDTVPDNSEVPSHSSADEWLGKLYEKEGKLDLAAAHIPGRAGPGPAKQGPS